MACIYLCLTGQISYTGEGNDQAIKTSMYNTHHEILCREVVVGRNVMSNESGSSRYSIAYIHVFDCYTEAGCQ